MSMHKIRAAFGIRLSRAKLGFSPKVKTRIGHFFHLTHSKKREANLGHERNRIA